MNFQLSYTIIGHNSDVRTVASTPDGQLLTGSRDCSAKLWEWNKADRTYSHKHTFGGHSKFVSAVCTVTNVSDNVLVVTGSNDRKIRVFDINDAKLVLELEGHRDTVCCVKAGDIPGKLISSSLDGTSAVWDVESATKTPLRVMTGHTQAVWDVLQMPFGITITASADKTIKLWGPEGECINTLSGHTDCVRGLAVHSATDFLSCSNDAAVKLWDIVNFSCLATYYSHSNYIYSISSMPGDETLFATCGEDSCLKIWKGGECLQTIGLPCQSGWAITFLCNGDIAVGSSDSVVRIFTATSERVAPAEELAAYDKSVTLFAISAKERIAGIDTKSLPDISALRIPGTNDGQTKLINEAGIVNCYRWSASTQVWDKLGEVVGANSGNQKQVYKGKQYDYVFSVDIQEGAEPLKLPFNDGEDPWVAAQKFIHENNLSQHYLDSVANFIMKNISKEDTHCVPSVSDPFTGTNRYVPARKNVSDQTETPSTPGQVGRSEEYFPQKTCVSFNVYNNKTITEKLLANNSELGELRVRPEKLMNVLSLLEEEICDSSEIKTLMEMLHWPDEMIVPALDLVRVIVRKKTIYKMLFKNKGGLEFVSTIEKCMQPGSSEVVQVLAWRTLCNVMSHPESHKMFLSKTEKMIDCIKSYPKPYSKAMQITLATVLLNLAVAASIEHDVAALSMLTPMVMDVLPMLTDYEAKFRALVALGTLVWDFDLKPCEQPLELVTGNKQAMNSLLQMASGSGQPAVMTESMYQSAEKVQLCAVQLLRKLTHAKK